MIFTDDAQTTIAVSFRIRPSRIIYETSNVILESLVVTYLPCPSSPSSHAVLLTCAWHESQLSDWLLKSYDIFSLRKGQEKLNLIQLSSEQNGIEIFPVHAAHAHAQEIFCSVPFHSSPWKIFCKWKST